jgi:hypothetical protein
MRHIDGRRFATVFATLAIGLVGIASPVSAAETAPAPVFMDVCGMTQDTIYLPPYFDSNYYINGIQYEQGKTYKASDTATSGTVTATGLGTGSWPFAFTNSVCPPQAANSLRLVAAECDTTFDTWITRISFSNPADGSGLSTSVLKMRTVRTYDTRTYALNDVAPVADGQSVEFLPGGTDIGLLPGHYVSTAYENGVAVASVKFFLDKCGFEYPPWGDTEYYGPSGGYPQGKLKQLSGHRVLVKMINKHNPADNGYQLIAKSKSGTTTTKYTVRIFKNKSLVVRAAKGTLLTLEANHPVLAKKLQLARLRVK